jgi:peptidoglycan/xylan/chitin deacetylase (PgdA/CDA1 family)
MYHLVHDHIVNPMSVSLRSFQMHLSILQEMGVTLLTLADVDAALDGTRRPMRGVLLTFDDGYSNSIHVVLPLLERYKVPAVIALCSAYLKVETRPVRTIHPSQDFASIDDIAMWLASGREIAGHSYTHPRLTSLPDDQIVFQVAQDKLILESTFSHSVDTFVYPFGAVNKRVEQIVAIYYRNAFSDSGGHWPSYGRRLAMRRMQVRPEWSPLEFRSHLEYSLYYCLDEKDTNSPTGAV